jgi:hypothetical protein
MIARSEHMEIIFYKVWRQDDLELNVFPSKAIEEFVQDFEIIPKQFMNM